MNAGADRSAGISPRAESIGLRCATLHLSGNYRARLGSHLRAYGKPPFHIWPGRLRLCALALPRTQNSLVKDKRPGPALLLFAQSGSPEMRGRREASVGAHLGACEGASHAAPECDHASEVPAVRCAWAAGEGERERLDGFVFGLAPAAR